MSPIGTLAETIAKDLAPVNLRKLPKNFAKGKHRPDKDHFKDVIKQRLEEGNLVAGGSFDTRDIEEIDETKELVSTKFLEWNQPFL